MTSDIETKFALAKGVCMSVSNHDSVQRASAILRAAMAAVEDVVPSVDKRSGAVPRNIAPQPSRRSDQTDPPRRPLEPRQLTAARLLLAGSSVTATARQLRVHRYTVSRWKADSRFQAELRRQVAVSAAPRNLAPRKDAYSQPPASNKATAGADADRYTAQR